MSASMWRCKKCGMPIMKFSEKKLPKLLCGHSHSDLEKVSDW